LIIVRSQTAVWLWNSRAKNALARAGLLSKARNSSRSTDDAASEPTSMPTYSPVPVREANRDRCSMAAIFTVSPPTGSTARRNRSARNGCRSLGTLLHSSSSSHSRTGPSARTMPRIARLSGPNITRCCSVPIRSSLLCADTDCRKPADSRKPGVVARMDISLDRMSSAEASTVVSRSTSPTTLTVVAASASVSSPLSSPVGSVMSRSIAIDSSPSCTSSSVSISSWVPRSVAGSALSAWMPPAEPMVRRST
jgi:hypothetical protein